ncbi:hypothetical protein BD779DRAFT_425994 [Infundibulicybe gibba]|nr:hypothetical protein BD779DRAFT_425994 [Infundibulicybe gibba]
MITPLLASATLLIDHRLSQSKSAASEPVVLNNSIPVVAASTMTVIPPVTGSTTTKALPATQCFASAQHAGHSIQTHTVSLPPCSSSPILRPPRAPRPAESQIQHTKRAWLSAGLIQPVLPGWCTKAQLGVWAHWRVCPRYHTSLYDVTSCRPFPTCRLHDMGWTSDVWRARARI